MVRPLQQEKLAPCCSGCASGTDVRGWIALVAQRRKLGLSDDEAYARAWETVTSVNPFPAIMGRICPHPCQTGCSRAEKDGAVAINALERFLGDWGLARGLRLQRVAEPGSRPESIGVIGAGPAGLSFAYQMARQGYRVTVYEKASKPGGMLYYGIPQYRLPEEVLEAEVARILELGVELRLNTAVGRDVALTTLRDRHDILFLGIGAGRGLALEITGEEGPGTWTGTDYLSRVNRGEAVELGTRVVVVGGGNTAVDAARAARRAGASVTMLYRRTRAEMPAIEAEVEDALSEGVQIEYLTAPVEIARENGRPVAVLVRRMTLGEPDGSGRRAPVPIPGSEYRLPADGVIAAVSQQPDWDGLVELQQKSPWVEAARDGELKEGLWTGGDTRSLGIAGRAIGQGRQAAEALHARLQGVDERPSNQGPPLPTHAVKPDFYADRPPVAPARRPADQWLTAPDSELQDTITEAAFLQEVARCFSCGLCYGCEQCFMYCNADGFTRLGKVLPGAYFAVSLDRCQACGECADLCPCGFLTSQ
jgi:NADPH-dependent glutamate synthase beta subunit-like oxidoreductase/Pyruvate/2-oxoacid:ferredoxin oxidoreductase delta subunit